MHIHLVFTGGFELVFLLAGLLIVMAICQISTNTQVADKVYCILPQANKHTHTLQQCSLASVRRSLRLAQ